MKSQPYIEVHVWTKESEAPWLFWGRQCRRLYDSTNAACSAKNDSSSAPLQFQEWERWDRMRFTHHCVLHTTSPTLKPFEFRFTQTTQFGEKKWSYCQDHLHTNFFCNCYFEISSTATFYESNIMWSKLVKVGNDSH